jgi:hypothetical protein
LLCQRFFADAVTQERILMPDIQHAHLMYHMSPGRKQHTHMLIATTAVVVMMAHSNAIKPFSGASR